MAMPENVDSPRRIPKISLKKFEQETERIGDSTSFSKKTSKTHTPKSMHDWCIMGINTIRDPIADIQEKRGISRHQRFTFVDLMSALFNHSYNSCLCIITMIMGLLPLLEGLLNLVRFILDKILEIDECKNIGEKVCKTFIFIGELFVIFVIVSLIVTIILLPVANLIQYTLYKIWRLAN